MKHSSIRSAITRLKTQNKINIYIYSSQLYLLNIPFDRICCTIYSQLSFPSYIRASIHSKESKRPFLGKPICQGGVFAFINDLTIEDMFCNRSDGA